MILVFIQAFTLPLVCQECAKWLSSKAQMFEWGDPGVWSLSKCVKVDVSTYRCDG